MTNVIQKITIAVDKNGMNPLIKITEGGQFLTLARQEYDGLFMANHPDSVIFDTWWSLDPNNVETEVQLHILTRFDDVPPNTTYLGGFFPFPGEFHVFQKNLGSQ